MYKCLNLAKYHKRKIETAIPRHNEIKEFTARSIIKTLSPVIKEK